MISNQITVFPRATEKTYGLSKGNVYVFDAPVKANKNEILKAIENQYSVTILEIKTLVQKGKAVRYSRGKRANPGTTTRQDFKKAYVTLADGSKIKIFDEIENAENKAKTESPSNKKEKK